MVTKQCDSLGLKFNVSVPADVAEYDTLAKRPGACLNDAISSTLYRSTFADFRWKFVQAIEEMAKKDPRIPLMTRTKVKAEDGTESEEITETEAKYWKRVKAALGLETDEAAQTFFATTISEIEKTLKCDPSLREKSEKAPSISKQITEMVDGVLAKGDATAAKFAKRLSKELGRAVEPTRESLLLAVKDWDSRERERIEKERAAQRARLTGDV